ncbi:hypothetical protein HMPREF9535_03923, partial [Escherichia coli MS 78-1]
GGGGAGGGGGWGGREQTAQLLTSGTIYSQTFRAWLRGKP